MSWYKIAQLDFDQFFEENAEEDVKPILLKLLTKNVPDDLELTSEINEAVLDLADEVDAWGWMIDEKPNYISELKEKVEKMYPDVKEKNIKYRNNPKEAPAVAPPLGKGEEGAPEGGGGGGDLGGLGDLLGG